SLGWLSSILARHPHCHWSSQFDRTPCAHDQHAASIHGVASCGLLPQVRSGGICIP
ncbi:unnamed protein product, partial [Durusdinium trenchii]